MSSHRSGRAVSGRPRLAWLAVLAGGLASLYLASLCVATAGRAATTESVVTDPLTGIAIFGFDPVAYFVDRAPRRGLASLEFKHAGVVWRFHNEGDRAAFAAHPEIYLPRFGGYDPLAVARRAPAPGVPALFVVHDNRLYLFASEESRTAFLDNTEEAIAAAEAAWPRLVRHLVP